MRKFFFIFILIFISGCNKSSNNSSSSNDLNNSTISKTNDEKPLIVNKKNCVSVFTLAPVVNAIVLDDNNQTAIYDYNSSLYCFKNDIKYPIIVKSKDDTFIDTDYDNKMSSVDVLPINYFKEKPLKSFCNNVNLLTNFYYETGGDSNITKINNFIEDIENKYDVNLCSNIFSKNNQKLLFASYNYLINSQNENSYFNNLNDLDSYVLDVDNFFVKYLNNLEMSDLDEVKYYSIYASLLYLDKSLLKRADTVHKPKLPRVLGVNLEYKNPRYDDVNTHMDAFDILPVVDEKFDDIYIAAGQDELAQVLQSDFSQYSFSSLAPNNAFGFSLYKEKGSGDRRCLYLADGNAGVVSFEITNDRFYKRGYITGYYDDKNKTYSFTNNRVLGVNGYISPNGSKRLFSILTNDNGVKLVKLNRFNSNCFSSKTLTINDKNITIDDINASDVLINENGGYSIDSAFRDDGTFVYFSLKDKGIEGYDLTALDPTLIKNSNKTFTLGSDSQEAYKLKLFNNDNELLVSTDKGLQIYDVLNNNDLKFIKEYKSEGAMKDYFPSIDIYDDFVFFTDGYKGLKILKLSTSLEPMLCGVEYFSPKSKLFELAKVQSVKHYIDKNGNIVIVVGVSSYGVVKFKLKDVLFKHCQNLL